MRCDFFHVPAIGSEVATETLNAFLNSVRVLSVDRQFVTDGANSFWSICVQSQDPSHRSIPTGKKPPIDYREVLPPEDFAVFAALRSLRKTIAADEAIPAYSVFTNEQLAQMVRRRITSLKELKEIDGIGEARVERYGAKFLASLEKQTTNQSNGAL